MVATAGCDILGAPAVTAMHLANVQDRANTGRRAEKLWDQQRQNVRDLQAEGNPMGDYLYALGNLQGWIDDTKDPIKIRDLLEKAAGNGSSDANIVLGIFYFSGVVPDRFTNTPIKLPKELRDRDLGLRLIREGIAVRCTYAEPAVDVYGNRAYMRYVSGAEWIWLRYRDGVYERDASGHYFATLEKNPGQEKIWHDIDIKCRASSATNE